MLHTNRARKNLYHRKAIAPSSSVEGDLWLVLSIKLSRQGLGCRSAHPDRAGWGGLEEGGTWCPLHITPPGMSPSVRAPAYLVIPVLQGKGFSLIPDRCMTKSRRHLEPERNCRRRWSQAVEATPCQICWCQSEPLRNAGGFPHTCGLQHRD